MTAVIFFKNGCISILRHFIDRIVLRSAHIYGTCPFTTKPVGAIKKLPRRITYLRH